MTFEKITPFHISALKNLLGLGAILVDLDKVDYTRGRIETKPQCFKMWTTDRKRIDVDVITHGQDSPAVLASQTREIAEDWPEEPAFPDYDPLSEATAKPPYPYPKTKSCCINPFCTHGENGTPALVDVSKKKSGACCRGCMNFECTHPDCIARAEANEWPRATHPWGTKIAKAHQEWRKQ